MQNKADKTYQEQILILNTNLVPTAASPASLNHLGSNIEVKHAKPPE